jgi:hypothetical protein
VGAAGLARRGGWGTAGLAGGGGDCCRAAQGDFSAQLSIKSNLVRRERAGTPRIPGREVATLTLHFIGTVLNKNAWKF